MNLSFSKYLGILFHLMLLLGSHQAFGFSLGLRLHGGVEMASLTAVQLQRLDDMTFITKTDVKDVKRFMPFYGADLALSPIEFGSSSLSLLVGYRSTSAKTVGQFSDEIAFAYLPVGMSFDYASQKVRLSGYVNYDLGLSQKMKLTVEDTKSSLNAKISGLSRIRFGGLSEFFMNPNMGFSVFADYAMGSFKNESGTLNFSATSGETIPASYVANAKNKISGISFGGGFAFYVPAPLSQRPPASPKSQKTRSSKKTGKAGAGKSTTGASEDGKTKKKTAPPPEESSEFK
ncbi:MAG: hypothetical protein RIR26_326 [Pseudomonadota bacterium]